MRRVWLILCLIISCVCLVSFDVSAADIILSDSESAYIYGYKLCDADSELVCSTVHDHNNDCYDFSYVVNSKYYDVLCHSFGVDSESDILESLMVTDTIMQNAHKVAYDIYTARLSYDSEIYGLDKNLVDVPMGYYLLTVGTTSRYGDGTVWMGVIAYDDVYLYPKFTEPGVSKSGGGLVNVDESGIAHTGFQVSGFVPGNLNSFDEYVYILHDRMSEGLSIVEDSLQVVLTNGKQSVDIIDNCDVSISGDKTSGVSIDVSVKDLKKQFEQMDDVLLDSNATIISNDVSAIKMTVNSVPDSYGDYRNSYECITLSRSSVASGLNDLSTNVVVIAKIPKCFTHVFSGQGGKFYEDEGIMVWETNISNNDKLTKSLYLSYDIDADVGYEIEPVVARIMFLGNESGSDWVVGLDDGAVVTEKVWSDKVDRVEGVLDCPGGVVLDKMNHFVYTCTLVYDAPGTSVGGYVYPFITYSYNDHGRNYYKIILSGSLSNQVKLKNVGDSYVFEFDLFVDSNYYNCLSYGGTSSAGVPGFSGAMVVSNCFDSGFSDDILVDFGESYSHFGWYVQMTYSALFEPDFDNGLCDAENEVHLEFSNSPTTTKRGLSKVVFVKTPSMVITKRDGDTNSIVPGAGFTLYEYVNGIDSKYCPDGSGFCEFGPCCYVPVADYFDDDGDGKIMIPNIRIGEAYILRETVVPDGYASGDIIYFRLVRDYSKVKFEHIRYSACGQSYFDEELYRLDHGLNVLPDGQISNDKVLNVTTNERTIVGTVRYQEKCALSKLDPIPNYGFVSLDDVWYGDYDNSKVDDSIMLPETGGSGVVSIVFLGAICMICGFMILKRKCF